MSKSKSGPESKNSPASTPDQLVSSGKGAAVELSAQQLDGVTGGGSLNKAKAADKAYTQMDGYIKQ